MKKDDVVKNIKQHIDVLNARLKQQEITEQDKNAEIIVPKHPICMGCIGIAKPETSAAIKAKRNVLMFMLEEHVKRMKSKSKE